MRIRHLAVSDRSVKRKVEGGGQKVARKADGRRKIIRILSLLSLLFPTHLLAQGTAVVRGRITLGEKNPLAGATVIVEDSLRARTMARTDAQGRFQMRVKAPASYQLAVTRVGTTPTVGPRFEVIPEDTIDANVQVPIVASDTLQALDSVLVTATGVAPSARLQEFETRRLNKAGTFFVTRGEIEKRSPVDAWQMLQHSPGIQIRAGGASGAGMYAVTSRAAQTSLDNRKPDAPCYLRVLIDGVMLPDPMPDLSHVLPKPSDIHGMEVWAGPASIPPQYGGSGGGKWCGMIAVWTK
jgi:hypothetical protein